MSIYPKEILNLIHLFSRLPGLGPKSAERLVFYLLDNHSQELIASLEGLNGKIRRCSLCGNYTIQNTCDICRDPKRDQSIIAVVARPQDIMAIERSNEFNGVYHILGGLLVPLKGITAEKLHIKELEARVNTKKINELILAFDSTVEGESTALYLKQIFEKPSLKLSRLARGLPVGADLEYADEITLRDALKNRQQL